MRASILIFLKAPRLGFVKTRLAKSVGDQKALETFKRLAERQVAALPSSYPVELHFTPEDAVEEMRAWFPRIKTLVPQMNGDLGERLKAAAEQAFHRGAKSIICIGGDCPELSAQHIRTATKQLFDGKDVVFGPSQDGGYYLIALNPNAIDIFDNIPWSQPDTLQKSLQRAETLGLKVSQLETLYDIDEVADLERAKAAGII